jgi:hypothetical protein
LYYRIDELLTTHGVNQNLAYVDAIRAIKGDYLATFDCIANHINLCNRCRPEKVAEAKVYIAERIPPQITFDRLIVRNTASDEEDVVLEIPLF